MHRALARAHTTAMQFMIQKELLQRHRFSNLSSMLAGYRHKRVGHTAPHQGSQGRRPQRWRPPAPAPPTGPPSSASSSAGPVRLARHCQAPAAPLAVVHAAGVPGAGRAAWRCRALPPSAEAAASAPSAGCWAARAACRRQALLLAAPADQHKTAGHQGGDAQQPDGAVSSELVARLTLQHQQFMSDVIRSL